MMQFKCVFKHQNEGGTAQNKTVSLFLISTIDVSVFTIGAPFFASRHRQPLRTTSNRPPAAGHCRCGCLWLQTRQSACVTMHQMRQKMPLQPLLRLQRPKNICSARCATIFRRALSIKCAARGWPTCHVVEWTLSGQAGQAHGRLGRTGQPGPNAHPPTHHTRRSA